MRTWQTYLLQGLMTLRPSGNLSDRLGVVSVGSDLYVETDTCVVVWAGMPATRYNRALVQRYLCSLGFDAYDAATWEDLCAAEEEFLDSLGLLSRMPIGPEV